MILDTDELVYIIGKHKYYITDLGVLNRYNVTLSKEFGEGESSGVTEAKVFRFQVSDRVYRWIGWMIRRDSKKIIEKRIADDIEIYGVPFREAIEEALYLTCEWMLNFDGDLKAQDNNDMQNLIPVEAQSILRESGIAFQGRIEEQVADDEWRVGY